MDQQAAYLAAKKSKYIPEKIYGGLSSFINFFKNSIEYEEKDDGSTGSILRYDPVYAITFSWLIPRKGSVFSLPDTLLVLGISVAIVMLLGYGSCVNQKHQTPCVVLPDANITYLTLLELCSFVVGMFANNVFKRWWELRSSLQDMEIGGEQLVATFAGVLLSDVKDATTEHDKRVLRKAKHALMTKLIGQLVLAYRLLFNAERDTDDISDLVDNDFLTQDEHDYFKSNNYTTLQLCGVMLNYIQEAARQNLLLKEHKLSQSNMTILQSAVLRFRAASSTVGLYINTQLPYPFIQLISAVSYMFIIQLTLVCAAFVARGLSTGESADITTGVLTICLYNFVIFGLLRLFDVLANPLGHDAADFPGDTYMAEFGENLRSVAKNAFVLVDMQSTSVSKSIRLASKFYSKSALSASQDGKNESDDESEG